MLHISLSAAKAEYLFIRLPLSVRVEARIRQPAVKVEVSAGTAPRPASRTPPSGGHGIRYGDGVPLFDLPLYDTDRGERVCDSRDDGQANAPVPVG